MCALQPSAQSLKTAFQSCFASSAKIKMYPAMSCQIVIETVNTMREAFIFFLKVSFDINQILHLISVDSRLSHAVSYFCYSQWILIMHRDYKTSFLAHMN